VLWAIVWLHTTGVHRYGAFVVTLFVVILLTAATIVGYGFATPPAVFLHAAASATGIAFVAPAAAPASFAAFGAVCTLFICAYGGISAAPSLGGETIAAEATMPHGLVLGRAVAMVLFTAVAYALFHAAPWWAVVALIHAKKAALATAPGLMGLIAPPVVSWVLNLAVALIVGKTIAPALLINSRLLFAFAQDRILAARFAATSTAKVPVAGLIATALGGSVFLIQSAYIGWALGVVVRALSILLVWLAVALGVLWLAFGPVAARQTIWARGLLASPFTVPAAIVSVVITLYLISTVIGVPHTAIWFQPIFQSLAAAAIAALILVGAAGRARARGESLITAFRTAPLE
jgi:amino acid transporter